MAKIESDSGDDLIYLGDGKENIIRHESNIIELSEMKNTLVSDEDLIITVGNDKLTIKDVAGKNVSFKLSDGTTKKISLEKENPTWTLNDTTATYETKTETFFTIEGIKFTRGC